MYNFPGTTYTIAKIKEQMFLKNPARRPLNRFAKTVLPISLLMVFFIGTGIIGIDFGHHWDEKWTQLDPLIQSVQNKTLLPGQYLYPSVTHWLNLFGAAVFCLPHLLQHHGKGAALLKAVDAPGFLLWLRGIRVIFTALSLLWIYLAVLIWRRNRPQALLAASLLGLSWEVAYHARYVAVDCLQMQFAALTLLLLLAALQYPQRRIWLLSSAIGAGLVFGTKYPGGLMIVPVLAAAIYNGDRSAGRGKLLVDVARLLLVFVAAYLVSTPGTLFQSGLFWHDIDVQRNIYSQGHTGHTIPSGLPIFSSMCGFYGLAFFSRFAPIALFFGMCTLIGIYRVVRESWKIGTVLLVFPLSYLLYFSTFRVMIVRNLLVLAPVLAMFASEGAVFLWCRFKQRSLRTGLIILLAMMLTVNAAWIFYAAQSIRYRGTDRYTKTFVEFASKRTRASLYVSPRVAADVLALNGRLPLSMTRDQWSPAVAQIALFNKEEPGFFWGAPATGPFLFDGWFGPLEVNMNFYPNWFGDDRIMLISKKQAGHLGMPVP